MANWESGKKIPKWKNIEKIAEIFNVSPVSLIDEMEEKPEPDPVSKNTINPLDIIYMTAKILTDDDEKTKKLIEKALKALLESSEEVEDHADNPKANK